jgi:phosphotriesterase-related protein
MQTIPGSEVPVVMTVLGPRPLEHVGICDAHNHVWIDVVPGAAPDSPHLNDSAQILTELVEYRLAGGNTILDCQPVGCGRNAIHLYELSRASGVNLVACTGFHRQRYYASDYWLWQRTADEVSQYLIREFAQGLEETRNQAQIVRPGFIKFACEIDLAHTPQPALEGVAFAAATTRTAIEIHTEKGGDAENIVRYFLDHDVSAHQLILCHIDKRPDFGLHSSLAQAGVLLEYDTFYRAKYAPQHNLWPLIEKMIFAGLSSSMALATDIAEENMRRSAGGPGFVGFLTIIRAGLADRGISPGVMKSLLGGNIAYRLAI